MAKTTLKELMEKYPNSQTALMISMFMNYILYVTETFHTVYNGEMSDREKEAYYGYKYQAYEIGRDLCDEEKDKRRFEIKSINAFKLSEFYRHKRKAV